MNKFYKKHGARGTAKRNDNIWVARNNDHEVIAAARITRIFEYSLLVGVYVDDKYRGNGVANSLLTELMVSTSQVFYTFPYTSLVTFYSALGFKLIEVAQLPQPILNKLEVYQNQGRNIVAMAAHIE
ncbi:GNAT family N-acetyltransferase [Flocculibacter collagenilyticus]|uniref:GNAT family N-acetyltransferase n=1 Tax=Flocculibacter collagenilyticus TaxID=2744479 RepID=UPI0018F6B266|nr:GNAT family N-acetyltransferase [Flocculibacter collagenilyticus]